ncbi:MAG: caspase family protein [Rhodospirillales bacterium]|jgi:hypothetical protein|nr:caspase family protein [Rhodospirillales bacterium]MDP7216176.1 caspase family protein [Rhodospirillales bacterium]HIJ93616.1 caspase family protein [Rhodospirillaceae bacterium]HJP53583.1 caspase family protein [Rhodospirillales bacterium]
MRNGGWLAAAVFTALLLPSPTLDAAETRGIEVTLRASEAPGAAAAGTVKLYGSSHALVIGIDGYSNGWPRLGMAVKDAKRVAEELRRQGFDVTLKTDLEADELRAVLRRFFAIEGAPVCSSGTPATGRPWTARAIWCRPTRPCRWTPDF